MDRYGKNVVTAQKICKILGYRLVSYEPNWTIAPVEEKLPKRLLELMSNQVMGKHDLIPDEFMGRIALIMGFEWEFPMQDDQLKMLITQCGEVIKEAEENEKLRMQQIEKEVEGKKGTKKFIEGAKKEGEDYVNETKAECEQKVKTFEFIIKFREKLRNWKKFGDDEDRKDRKRRREMFPDSEAADEALAH